MPNNEKIFLQADRLLEIKPLRLVFIKGEIELSDNNRKIIQQWTKHVLQFDVPIFIHSFASQPTGIRNLTPDIAQHEAIRIAFNRGLIVKNILEQCGINKNRLILKAIDSNKTGLNDQITITTRRD